MNNILVTGGAGYIGSHIVEQLVKTKARIIIIDNLENGYKKLINKNAIFVKGDIKNLNHLRRIFYKYKINSVIHLAAYLNISEAEKNKKKYFKNNVIGTLNLIKCCKSSNIKHFVFSSSCSIYGSTIGAVSEKTRANPKGYYAYTKHKSEKIIIKYAKRYNYNYAILRYFNIAGASPSNKIGEINSSHGHLFKNIAIQSLKKKPVINVYGNNYKTKDGTCIRDYMHVSDLSIAHIKALKFLKEKSKSITLNCGYGKGYSVLEILNIFQKMKKNLKINFVERRRGDVAAVYSNTKKFKKIFNMNMKYDNIHKILKSSIKWERILKKRK